MPFNIVQTVVPAPSTKPEETFSALTKSGRRVFATKYSHHLSQNGFYLVQAHWPLPVRHTVAELMAALQRRGITSNPNEFDAWVDPKRGLVVGQRIYLIISLRPSESRIQSTKRLTLRGLVDRFDV